MKRFMFVVAVCASLAIAGESLPSKFKTKKADEAWQEYKKIKSAAKETYDQSVIEAETALIDKLTAEQKRNPTGADAKTIKSEIDAANQRIATIKNGGVGFGHLNFGIDCVKDVTKGMTRAEAIKTMGSDPDDDAQCGQHRPHDIAAKGVHGDAEGLHF